MKTRRLMLLASAFCVLSFAAVPAFAVVAVDDLRPCIDEMIKCSEEANEEYVENEKACEKIKLRDMVEVCIERAYQSFEKEIKECIDEFNKCVDKIEKKNALETTTFNDIIYQE